MPRILCSLLVDPTMCLSPSTLPLIFVCLRPTDLSDEFGKREAFAIFDLSKVGAREEDFWSIIGDYLADTSALNKELA